MSCHTWTYKKANSLTIDQKRQMIVSGIKRLTSIYDVWSSPEEYIERMGEFYINEVKRYDRDLHGKPDDDEETKKLIDEWRKIDKTYLLNEYNERQNTLLNHIDMLSSLSEISVEQAYQYLIKHDEDILDDADITELNDEKYYHINSDIPLRCHEFSESPFTSKDSLLSFLKTINSNMYGYYDDNHEFVPGYTDELVRRIDTYFEENGEDNIAIEFG